MRGRRKILFCSSVKLGVLLLSTILAVTAALDQETFENLLHRVSSLSRTTSPQTFKQFAKEVRRTISASESQRRSIQSAIEPQRRSNHNGTTGHNETTTTTAPITANQTTSVAQTTSGIQTPSTTVRSETPAPLPEPDFGFRNIGAPRPLEDETFYVMIYELPPFVYIASAEAGLTRDFKDPGNVNQTRKVSNGGVRGLTIDALEEMAEILGCELRYIYPCRAQHYTATGLCDAGSSADALAMLDPVTAAEFLGGHLCADGRCFSGGAHKTSDQLLLNYRTSQHYLAGGFELVALESLPKPVLNTWANPFEFSLWILLAVEVVIVGIILYGVEFGFNPDMPKQHVPAILESIYWAFSTIMGIAGHSPETHAGRTMIMAQLFLTLLVVAIYTGNLAASLLATEPVTIIQTLSDLADTSSPTYLSGGSVCIALAHPSTKAYLNTIAVNLKKPLSEAFAIVEKDTLIECMQSVFLGESTTTFYDSAVIRSNLVDEFKLKGACGAGGAICSNNELTRGQCKCPPQRKPDGTCDDSLFSLEEGEGDLALIGNKFGEFGYSLVFHPSSRDYHPFDSAIAEMIEGGRVEKIKELWLPRPEDVPCAGSTGDEVVILTFLHLQGLCLFCGIVAIIGLVVAVCERFIHVFVKILDKFFLDDAKRKRLSAFPMYDPDDPPEDLMPPPPGGPIQKQEHFLIMALQDRMQQLEERLTVTGEVMDRFDTAFGVVRPPPGTVDELLAPRADEDEIEKRKQGLFGKTIMYLLGRTPSEYAQKELRKHAKKEEEKAAAAEAAAKAEEKKKKGKKGKGDAAALARKTAVEGKGGKEAFKPPPLMPQPSRLKSTGGPSAPGTPQRPKSTHSMKNVSFKEPKGKKKSPATRKE